MRPRVIHYSTTLPTRSPGGRRSLGPAASAILHLALLVLLVHQVTSRTAKATDATSPGETARPVQLIFAPPRPAATPRTPAPEVPAVPLTEGPEETPGSTAELSSRPEAEPNAQPNTPRAEATRPDPGESERVEDGDVTASAGTGMSASADNALEPALESEAQRIFGRPSSKLGPQAGSRDNRPWESAVDLGSRGCTLPPEEPGDSTLPPGMASVAGRILNQNTGRPLAGARLQILGTPYGTFSDGQGRYRLVFDRNLVNRCRTQAVRVTAPGYRGRDVLLYLGDAPNGDVALSRY